MASHAKDSQYDSTIEVEERFKEVPVAHGTRGSSQGMFGGFHNWLQKLPYLVSDHCSGWALFHPNLKSVLLAQYKLEFVNSS